MRAYLLQHHVVILFDASRGKTRKVAGAKMHQSGRLNRCHYHVLLCSVAILSQCVSIIAATYPNLPNMVHDII